MGWRCSVESVAACVLCCRLAGSDRCRVDIRKLSLVLQRGTKPCVICILAPFLAARAVPFPPQLISRHFAFAVWKDFLTDVRDSPSPFLTKEKIRAEQILFELLIKKSRSKYPWQEVVTSCQAVVTSRLPCGLPLNFTLVYLPLISFM